MIEMHNIYPCRSKNKLIEMLEHENRSCDESFKELINEYHVNIRSVIWLYFLHAC